MSARWLYTHGLSCIIQDPNAPGLLSNRLPNGLYIQQNANTSNWFHFTIPTLAADDDGRYEVGTAILSYDLLGADPAFLTDPKAHAVPLELQIHDGNHPIESFVFADKPGVLKDGSHRWVLTHAHKLNQGVVLSLKVRWDSSDASTPRVWFRSAGIIVAEDIHAVIGTV